MKSKTNDDATEELRDLTKDNGAGTNRSKKKRARTIFGTKSTEQIGSGTGKRSRSKLKIFLGR